MMLSVTPCCVDRKSDSGSVTPISSKLPPEYVSKLIPKLEVAVDTENLEEFVKLKREYREMTAQVM